MVTEIIRPGRDLSLVRKVCVERDGKQVLVFRVEAVPVKLCRSAEKLVFDIGKGSWLCGDVSLWCALAACCEKWDDGSHSGAGTGTDWHGGT